MQFLAKSERLKRRKSRGNILPDVNWFIGAGNTWLQPTPIFQRVASRACFTQFGGWVTRFMRRVYHQAADPARVTPCQLAVATPTTPLLE